MLGVFLVSLAALALFPADVEAPFVAFGLACAGWLLAALLASTVKATSVTVRETRRAKRQWRLENSPQQIAARRFEEATRKGQRRAEQIALAEERKRQGVQLIPRIDEAIAYLQSWPTAALGQLDQRAMRLPETPVELEQQLLLGWQQEFSVRFPAVREMDASSPVDDEPPLEFFNSRSPFREPVILPAEMQLQSDSIVARQREWGRQEYRRHVAWAEASITILQGRKSDLERQIAAADAELKRLR